MDAGGRAPTLGALGDAGAVAEDTKFDDSVGFSGSNLKSAIPTLSILRDLRGEKAFFKTC
jgi:hypothetical protein